MLSLKISICSMISEHDMEEEMALRIIRELGEQCLRKVCKPVKEMNERTKILIDDMFETMYDADGVGLAAPQVGIVKRIFVVAVGDEEGERMPLVFINPEILETSGEQRGYEGCLSVPGKTGIVTRPDHVKVKALDADMKEFELEADGFLARAILHEYDHLEGKVYVDIAEGPLYDNDELLAEQEYDGEEEE